MEVHTGIKRIDYLLLHTCFYCGHVGGTDEVIPGEYYDPKLGRDVFPPEGWVCKDQWGCYYREQLIKRQLNEDKIR